jgi:hypothetical protein
MAKTPWIDNITLQRSQKKVNYKPEAAALTMIS